MTDRVFVAGGGTAGSTPCELLLKLANRHGLVAGATGTGKTVTMQVLVEGLSSAGVPVFLADVKGDVSGLGAAGTPSDRLDDRARNIGMGDLTYAPCPVVFWDLFGRKGHPVRTTVTEMGPMLLAQMLSLTDVQEGVLHIAFHVADDQGLALLDLDDLRALLVWLGENSDEVGRTYGSVAKSSIGAIQRALLVLETEGAGDFLGEPALDLADMIATTPDGRGQVNVLAADQLIASPRLYAMFLLWLLSELFEELPEVGNPDKPVLVFFFDEAHLLFDTAPKALIQRVEQVVRLIRSKGVGVYFVTQKPDDVPEDVLAQLGNRVQHALRAFTPRDAKALKLAAETFRANPDFDTADAIAQSGTGEAVVSLLENKGVPAVAQQALIRPPGTRMGPLTDAERVEAMAASPVAGKYDMAVDRESAHEILTARAEKAAEEAEAQEQPEPTPEPNRSSQDLAMELFGSQPAPKPKPRARAQQVTRRYSPPRRQAQAGSGMAASLGKAMARQMVRELSTRRGQRMVRGMLGTLFKGR